MKLATGVTLKYSYPDTIPEYRPLPKKKQVYSDCDSSDSEVEIDTYNNQTWIQQTKFKTKEGSADISRNCKQSQNNDYNDLLEDLLKEPVKIKEPMPAIADYALSESEEDPVAFEIIKELPQ